MISDDEEKARAGSELAEAVLAFAEWQANGYGNTPDAEAHADIGRHLWFEVRDRVFYFTGQEPPNPSVRPD